MRSFIFVRYQKNHISKLGYTYLEMLLHSDSTHKQINRMDILDIGRILNTHYGPYKVYEISEEAIMQNRIFRRVSNPTLWTLESTS